MPIGSALPFAVRVSPGFLGCDRQGYGGRAIRSQVELGVLAGESNNGELIQIHDVFSIWLICLPQVSWGCDSPILIEAKSVTVK